MHLDHVSFAAGPARLEATAERLSQQLGEDFVDGGVHPRFGTRNRLLPLARGQYLEVVEVLDHPASDKAPFGQAVRAQVRGRRRMAGLGPRGRRHLRRSRRGWTGPAVPGNRHRPDGVELRWRQIGVKALQADPQLPFFIQWESDAESTRHAIRAAG